MIKEADISWDPSIYAAHAFAYNKFCVAIMNQESIEPFTAIINFDGTVSQPWARTDVPREICGLANGVTIRGHAYRYAALSSEGDLYYINRRSTTERISGSGLWSQDATGEGILRDILRTDEDLWVVGSSGQVYIRSDQHSWCRVHFDMNSPPGFRRANLVNIAGLSNNDIYMCGILRPNLIEMEENTVQELLSSGADPDTWDAAFAEIEKRQENLRTEDEARLFHWNGSVFRQLDTEFAGKSLFRSALTEAPDLVWVVGTEGLVIKGSAATGFHVAGNFDREQRFVSMTKFQDRYVIASEDFLWDFDGSNAKPFTQPFRHAPLRPIKVQAIDKSLFYFDNRSGVHRFDGSSWKYIKIPAPLLERHFKSI